MFIQSNVVKPGQDQGKQKMEYFVKELVESREVIHDLKPNHNIIYEKIEWRRALVQDSFNIVIEYKVKTEEFIKVIKQDKNAASSKCIRAYLLNDDQSYDQVIKQIQENY
ncbi:hypothetical protein ACJ2A9_03175 [Anaerobacillus sp. MEB173]|uniref:hypothetical protein n=1 Tax=Anaerobacillus sp. MEB173 TaxID=3383345 RepID=UPI003F8ECC73